MKFVAIFLASVLISTRISGESIEDRTYASHVYPGHAYPNHVNFREIFSNSISMLADDPLSAVTKDEDFHLPPSQYAEFRLISYTTTPTSPPPTTPTTTPQPRRSKRKAALRWNDILNAQEARKISADRTRRLIFKLPTASQVIRPSNRIRSILVNNMHAITGRKTRFLKPSFLRENESTSENPSSTMSAINGSTTVQTTTNVNNITTPSVDVVPLKNYQRGVLDLLLPASRVKGFRDVFQTFKRLLSYTFRK